MICRTHCIWAEQRAMCRIYKFFHYVQASSRPHCLCIVAELNILNFDVSPIGILEQKLLIRLFSVMVEYVCVWSFWLSSSHSTVMPHFTHKCIRTCVMWKRAKTSKSSESTMWKSLLLFCNNNNNNSGFILAYIHQSLYQTRAIEGKLSILLHNWSIIWPVINLESHSKMKLIKLNVFKEII